jgi:hypothetical protein
VAGTPTSAKADQQAYRAAPGRAGKAGLMGSLDIKPAGVRNNTTGQPLRGCHAGGLNFAPAKGVAPGVRGCIIR